MEPTIGACIVTTGFGFMFQQGAAMVTRHSVRLEGEATEKPTISFFIDPTGSWVHIGEVEKALASERGRILKIIGEANLPLRREDLIDKILNPSPVPPENVAKNIVALFRRTEETMGRMGNLHLANEVLTELIAKAIEKERGPKCSG